ncbi:MAG: hypothetical protein H0V44_15005 [Planctomycetes bacterium]|nr:hypothetical protein [Planctomycetota bacterium]
MATTLPRSFALSIAASLICAASLSSAVYEETVVIDVDQPICRSFLGFGAEWDPKFWTMGTFEFKKDVAGPVAVDEADWELVRKRLTWMRVKLVRMMMLTGWCTTGDGTFTYDNAHMRSLFRHLDLCREEGIEVILVDWGVASWTKIDGFTGTDDPRYAQAIGEYLEELIVRRKYDCIRSLTLVNEPNLEAESFERWRDGVRAVRAELAKRGLAERVRLVGSDDCSPPYPWHKRALAEMPDDFAAWEVHRYATQKVVESGSLEDDFRALSTASRAHDASKPFLVCEAGMSDGMSAGQSPFIQDPIYGLFMADYAVQACRGGCDAVLAWMLEDNSHAGFTWGMWTNKAEGMALKPWFWTWSLLCRTVPRGSQLFAPAQPDGIRVLTARHDGRWTAVIVNRRDVAVDVRVVLPGAQGRPLCRYVSAGDVRAVDGDGFPMPTGEPLAADAADGVVIGCPPQSAVVATAME